MRTFKYRIYPDSNTISLLNRWFGQTRFVWNYYLNARTVAYKDEKKSLNFAINCRDLTQLKKQPDTIWLKESPSQVLQQQLKVLDTTFADFFSIGKGYPRFKKREFSSDILHFPAGFKLEGNYITIPKVKNIRCHISQTKEPKSSKSYKED